MQSEDQAHNVSIAVGAIAEPLPQPANAVPLGQTSPSVPRQRLTTRELARRRRQRLLELLQPQAKPQRARQPCVPALSLPKTPGRSPQPRPRRAITATCKGATRRRGVSGATSKGHMCPGAPCHPAPGRTPSSTPLPRWRGTMRQRLRCHGGVLRYPPCAAPRPLGKTLVLATVTLAPRGAWAECSRGEHSNPVWDHRCQAPCSQLLVSASGVLLVFVTRDQAGATAP
jgi:hypothetical protein